jgi:hypothetical protein
MNVLLRSAGNLRRPHFACAKEIVSEINPVKFAKDAYLGWIFFLSGFAAMIYQLVWQRALYAIFGINIESVTIVVTAFLFGLGVGSLVGGSLSERGRNLLALFAAAELSVGLYGILSLRLFRWIGGVGLALPHTANAFLTLLALLPPTLLMGLTLPLLVTHGVATSLSSGKTVGSLYFANTIGSAVAAFAAVLALLPGLGEQGSVNFAATLNFIVGFFVLARLAVTARTA